MLVRVLEVRSSRQINRDQQALSRCGDIIRNAFSWTDSNDISKLNGSARRNLGLKKSTGLAKKAGDWLRTGWGNAEERAHPSRGALILARQRKGLSFSCRLSSLPPPRRYQDKFPLIANCVILLFYINFSPTGYFSLLSGKHLSTWNYYSARASGETQTVVNLVELWWGLSSLDGQSTGGAEGPNRGPLLSVKETRSDIYISCFFMTG